MLTLLFTIVVTLQDPPPQGGAPATPAAPVAAEPMPLAAVDDKAAKAAVDTFNKAAKGKRSMNERMKAVEELAQGANKAFVKPLVGVAENDESLVVRKRAVVLLSLQPAPEAPRALRALLKSKKVEAAPAVLAEVVSGIARSGYDTTMWPDIEPLFASDYAAERVGLQEAILALVTKHKEHKAAKLLLDNLDEPVPADEHDPSNPPAEYWKARWYAWKAWREKVKEALFALTGQRFSTAAEAKAWLDKNKRK